MAKYQITSPDGQKYEVTAPDDASQDEVLAYAQRSFKMASQPKQEATPKPFGQQLNELVADAPRTAGRGARALLEGVGNVADFITSPLRNAANAYLANSQEQIDRFSQNKSKPLQFQPGAGTALADAIGLPKPQNTSERIADAAISTIGGGVLPIGIGSALASRASGAAQGVGRAMAANPAMQALSAGSAGAAGQYTKETGGNDVSQFIASLAAGVGAPMAAGAIASGVRSAAARSAASRAPVTASVDVTINNALQDSGLSLADLPTGVAAGIRADVAKAMETGSGLNADAVRRLADYRLTGLTPTRAKLTQDVADITRQANLSKLGANSSDPAAQQLAQVQNQNNRAMTSGLNSLGAATTDDVIAGGQKIIGALDAQNAAAQNAINEAYKAARDTSGRAAALDPYAFTQRAGNLLNEANLESFLTPDIRNKLNAFASGKTPLTVEIAEQFKTGIGNIQRNSSDGNVRTALGLVRQALDETPLQQGQQIGQASIDAFNQARSLNRQWMQTVEKTPALQAIRDGIEPDKFVQKYIIAQGGNANVMDVSKLKNLIANDEVALGAVREQMLSYLKQKALSGAADEVGNFSQSAYNKALNAIGDRKLRLFFEPQDIAQLKALGRVASYEQFQPVGSAVNNSNTAGAVGNILERIGASSLLGKIPFGRAAIGEPLQNISLSMQAGRVLNAPQALVGGPGLLRDDIARLSQPRAPLALSPAMVLGAQETPEQRRRRELGLPPRP